MRKKGEYSRSEIDAFILFLRQAKEGKPIRWGELDKCFSSPNGTGGFLKHYSEYYTKDTSKNYWFNMNKKKEVVDVVEYYHEKNKGLKVHYENVTNFLRENERIIVALLVIAGVLGLVSYHPPIIGYKEQYQYTINESDCVPITEPIDNQTACIDEECIAPIKNNIR